MKASSRQPSTAEQLPADVLVLLIKVATALQKHTMYPAGHPVLKPSLREAVRHLNELFGEEGGSLRVRVAPDHLTVGSASTPVEHPLLSGMARRLHIHRLLTVTFMANLGEDELSDFLTRVGRDPRRTSSALGASGPEELERWRHILLEPVPYEALSIAGAPEEIEVETVDTRQPDRFWERVGEPRSGGLADVEIPDFFEDPFTTGTAAVEPDPVTAAYGELLEDQLPALLEAWESSGQEGDAIREGVSQLILKLPPDKLVRLLQEARSANDDAAPADDGDGQIPPDAVDRLMEAAEDVGSGRVPLWLVRLLTKIGMYAESAAEAPSDSQAGGALTQLVQQLAGGWQVGDAKPADYEDALGRLINATPVLEKGRSWIEEPRAERIVQMSLEVDESRGAARRGVSAMLEVGQIGELLDLLEDAPEGSRAAEPLWAMVARPERVRQLLKEDPPDLGSLDRILPRVGIEAADPMLDALIEAGARSTRRELFNRLAALGPPVGPLAAARLPDDRWFARRNMLALLDRLPELPEDFTPAPYLKDPDPRVRHEAVKLAVRLDSLRDAAIVVALHAEEERTIALGLAAAQLSCPGQVVDQVLRHVRDVNLSTATRVHAVRVLRGVDAAEALRALLPLVWTRHWVFWRRLAVKDPVMLEALSAIARRWSSDPSAQKVLNRAARSPDPQVRAAAAGEDSV